MKPRSMPGINRRARVNEMVVTFGVIHKERVGDLVSGFRRPGGGAVYVMILIRSLRIPTDGMGRGQKKQDACRENWFAWHQNAPRLRIA